jgi:hypothetical protein
MQMQKSQSSLPGEQQSQSSLPGLTRQSILFCKKSFTKWMDPRVNGVPADNVGGVPRPAGDGRFAWREPGEGPTRAAIAVVIAGLDPAIHPLRKKVLTKRMDPRVNGVPADNVGGVPRPAGDGRFAGPESGPLRERR